MTPVLVENRFSDADAGAGGASATEAKSAKPSAGAGAAASSSTDLQLSQGDEAGSGGGGEFSLGDTSFDLMFTQADSRDSDDGAAASAKSAFAGYDSDGDSDNAGGNDDNATPPPSLFGRDGFWHGVQFLLELVDESALRRVVANHSSLIEIVLSEIDGSSAVFHRAASCLRSILRHASSGYELWFSVSHAFHPRNVLATLIHQVRVCECVLWSSFV